MWIVCVLFYYVEQGRTCYQRVHHLVHCEPAAAAFGPLGGYYGAKSESFARMGAVFDGYSVYAAVPAYDVCAWHLSFALVVYKHLAFGGSRRFFGPSFYA